MHILTILLRLWRYELRSSMPRLHFIYHKHLASYHYITTAVLYKKDSLRQPVLGLLGCHQNFLTHGPATQYRTLGRAGRNSFQGLLIIYFYCNNTCNKSLLYILYMCQSHTLAVVLFDLPYIH